MFKWFKELWDCKWMDPNVGPSDKEILERNMREHPNYWRLKTGKKYDDISKEFRDNVNKMPPEAIKEGELLKATPEQIERCKAHIRNRESLLPPDHDAHPEEIRKYIEAHEMTSEEVEAYKSECVSDSTKELKEDFSNMFKDCDTHPIPNPLKESTKEDKWYEGRKLSTTEKEARDIAIKEHSKNDGKESTKEDHDKCQLDIINPAYLEDLADVLTDGEVVYGLNNWRGLHFSRIIASMLRHMTAIQKGEDIDPDSGHPHAAHIAANAMFLHWWQANGFVKGKQDDRRWAGI